MMYVLYHWRCCSFSGDFYFCVQVVPCVEGIYFKDLKQTLKKEQCDVSKIILFYHSRHSHAVPFRTVRNTIPDNHNNILPFQSQSYPTIPNTIRSYHFKNCSHVLPFQHCHILPYNTVAYHPNTGCAISVSILYFIYKKVKRDQQTSLLRIWKRRMAHLTI